MKLTKIQRQDLEAIMPKALAHVKKHSSRTYKRLMDDLKEYTKDVPTLHEFKWSRERISKLKKTAGISMQAPKLTAENQEKKLVKWIREVRDRKMCSVVTTRLVKEKWAKIYYGKKKPSKSNLSRFRSRNGLKTFLNAKTGKRDIWKFIQKSEN